MESILDNDDYYKNFLREIKNFRTKEGIAYLDIRYMKVKKNSYTSYYPFNYEEWIIYIRNFPKIIDSKFYQKIFKEQKKLCKQFNINAIEIPGNYEIDYSYIIPEINKLYILEGSKTNIENLHNDVENIIIDCRKWNTKNGYLGTFNNLPINLKSLTIFSDTYYEFNNLPTKLKKFFHIFVFPISSYNYDFIPDSVEELWLYQIENPNEINLDFYTFILNKYGKTYIYRDEYIQDKDKHYEEYCEYLKNTRKNLIISHLPADIKILKVKSMITESVILNGNFDYWKTNISNDFEIDLFSYSNNEKIIKINKDKIIHSFLMNKLMHGTDINYFHLKPWILDVDFY